MSTIAFYARALELVAQHQPFVLASVVAARGSTPQKAGANALIEPNGSITGTLGGGCLEAESRRRALQALDAGRAAVFDLKLDEVTGWDDGLICGGSVRVLVNPLAADNAPVYDAVLAAQQRQERGILATVITHPHLPMGKAIWAPEATLASQDLWANRAEEMRDRIRKELPGQWLSNGVGQTEPCEFYLEIVTTAPQLLIAGGGHIGEAVGRWGQRLGFEVTLIDDRPAFADPQRHPHARKTICGDIARELAAQEIGPHTYVLIVTRGHRHDGTVLAACVKSRAAYIGMIGSRRKGALIRRGLVEAGQATQEEIDRVVSPIGVDIGAQTVEEIAVSIVAELVAVRRLGHLPQGAKNYIPGPRS